MKEKEEAEENKCWMQNLWHTEQGRQNTEDSLQYYIRISTVQEYQNTQINQESSDLLGRMTYI